jgi:hypothetical protein
VEKNGLAFRLVATSIDLVSIGIASPKEFSLWLYIYEDDILASRIHSPSRKPPDNVPADCSSRSIRAAPKPDSQGSTPWPIGPPSSMKVDLLFFNGAGAGEHALRAWKTPTV